MLLPSSSDGDVFFLSLIRGIIRLEMILNRGLTCFLDRTEEDEAATAALFSISNSFAFCLLTAYSQGASDGLISECRMENSSRHEYRSDKAMFDMESEAEEVDEVSSPLMVVVL